ncbi:uncharacterized protein [Lepeophtheirus salmonis]|uniref:uncharacterized protein isoform X2 n=1 Tax=Lepeophtheirus salmonis TaxID=72036 RepID=UPI003AF3424A
MGKDTELVDAAREGNYPLCEKLLSSKPKRAGPFASLRRANGSGTNCRDGNGYTALHYAALNGYKDIVELLLTYEASCNSVDQKGSSPLHLASWAGRFQIVEILLTHGPSVANPNLANADQETALHSASQYGHLEVVDLLLKYGADPNIKNARDETALDLAAQYGRVDTTSLLLTLHPELVCPYTAYGGTLYRHTPLHLASQNGHKEVIELILKAGFDINVRTPRGTALHEAAICGKIYVVEVLLQENVNPSLQDSNGKTVIDVMNDIKTPVSKEIIKIILEHGGNLLVSSPYENLSSSLSQSLDTYSLDLDLNTLSSSSLHHSSISSVAFAGGGGGAPRLRPRSAKSVEDILDRRISSFSATSGCSESTLTTAQDEVDSISFSNEGDTLLVFRQADTISISSNGSAPVLNSSSTFRNHGDESSTKVGDNNNFEDEESNNRTLTREKSPPPAIPPKPTQKPAIPAKPAHIRPGLKPVKIPKIDDKIILNQTEHGGVETIFSNLTDIPPPKPPRRNVSVSPIRKDAPIEPDELNLSSMESSQKTYSSKSCDELDDVVLKDGQKERGKTMNKYEDEVKNPSSSSPSNADVVSRHSCDEVMMTRSFHEGEISDTSSQLSSDCQRCLLNSISNRTMSLDCEGFWTSSGQARLISQRQYKRKIKRDTPGYVTLERRRGDKKTNKIHVNKVEDEVDGFILDNGLDTIKVSKTTYKLETQNQEPDSIELMEIPTSPTNYEQPSTPECDPPSPARAEEEISKVIEMLSKESKRHKRSKGTEIEEAYLFPIGKRNKLESKKVLQFASIGVGTDSGMNCINTTTMTNNQNTTSNNKIMELNILDDPGNKEVVNKEDSGSLNPNDSGAGSTEATRTSSILSPFDEKDEWLKISQIIDSFGTDIIGVDAKMNDEEETVKEESDSPQYSTWKRQEKVLNSVPEWLQYISCQQYADNFEVNGYDHLDFIGEGFISKEDLSDMGIKNENDCKHILESLISLKLSSVLMVETDPKTKISSIPEDVETWLESLHLSNYSEDFKKNNYDDMNRVKKIWDEELRTLLNIHKKGHRKRMLLSLMASSGDQTGSNAKSGFTAIDNRCKPPPLSQEQSSQASVPSKNDPSIGEHQHNTLQKQSSSTSSKKKSGKEKNSPSKTPPPVSKAHPLPPKLLKSKTTLMGRESLNLSGSNILSTTLGRRKKKTAPSTPAESNKKTSSKEEKIYLSYGVKYFGKKTVKDFKGNDSTKGAIEQIRRAKAGRLRYLLITDKTVTVIKRDTKEAVEVHNIDNICCVVHDKDDPRIMGYISNDKQKLTHVFSTDCKEKTSEILSVICEGFGEMRSKVKYQDPILPSSTGIIPGVLGNTPVASSGSDTKTSSPPSPVSKSKSDFLVSRMKLFFQGSSSSSSTNDSPSSIAPPIAVQSSISSSGAKSQEARRKRGGSVDDLIDRLDEPLTNESRLKSISTKNLNIIGSRTSSSSSSSSGAKSTVEEVKITTV